MPTGPVEFIRLIADVPDNASYAAKQVLNLDNVQINNGAIVSRDDDGLHLVAYLGDASGNGGLSSHDAALALRDVVGLDSGLRAFPLADPAIAIDTNGNGRVDSTDATRILQKAVGLSRPEIPDRPPGIVIPATLGPDPLLSIPKTLRGRPGDTITVPVNLDRSEELASLDLALSYDARRLEIVSVDDVQRGRLTADFDLMIVNLDAAAGTVRVGLSRSLGPIEDRGPGSVLLLTFQIKPDAPPGQAIINLRRDLAPTQTQLNEGWLVLGPAPSNRAGDILDGVITVRGLPLREVHRVIITNDSGQRSRAADVTTVSRTAVRLRGNLADAFHLVGGSGGGARDDLFRLFGDGDQIDLGVSDLLRTLAERTNRRASGQS